MNFTKIRSMNYKRSFSRHSKDFDIDLKSFFSTPYSYLKSRLFIELSSILVFLFQKTPITPNAVSISNSMLALLGAIFLGFGEDNMKFIGIIIFFFIGLLDWTDGLLAEVNKKHSKLGHVLDIWTGLVNYNLFVIGISIYLFNKTSDIVYLYLILVYLSFKFFDFKNFTYLITMYEYYKSTKKIKHKRNKNKRIKLSPILKVIKFLFDNILNDRSSWIDIILLVLTYEIMQDKIIASDIILFLICFKASIIFAGGIYICFFKNFVNSVRDKL